MKLRIFAAAFLGPVVLSCSAAAEPSLAAATPVPEEAPRLRLGPSNDINEPGKKKASDEAQHLAHDAMAAMTRGDLTVAKTGFLKVLQMAPDNVPTMINLGLVEYRQKHFDEAEKRLRAAVRLEPGSGLGWLILGVVQYDAAKYDHALASLAQAAVLEPKNATVHQYLGVTVGQKGWYSAAEDEMRKALELDPNYAEAHFNLAVFYLQRNPPAVELARRHYLRALELGAKPDPDVDRSLTIPQKSGAGQ